jgi:hypothetical protein
MVRRRIRSLVVALVIALIAGVVLQASRTVWVVLLLAVLLVWAITSECVGNWLPNVVVEPADDIDDFFMLRVRRPRASGRRLRKATEAIVNDWHHYQTSMTRPDPASYRPESEMARRDGIEIALRKRVEGIERKYRRRGLLGADETTAFPAGELPSDAVVRVDHLGVAIARLERLQARL